MQKPTEIIQNGTDKYSTEQQQLNLQRRTQK